MGQRRDGWRVSGLNRHSRRRRPLTCFGVAPARTVNFSFDAARLVDQRKVVVDENHPHPRTPRRFERRSDALLDPGITRAAIAVDYRKDRALQFQFQLAETVAVLPLRALGGLGPPPPAHR